MLRRNPTPIEQDGLSKRARPVWLVVKAVMSCMTGFCPVKTNLCCASFRVMPALRTASESPSTPGSGSMVLSAQAVTRQHNILDDVRLASAE